MLTIQSSAFSNNNLIPSRYTCDDENINPDLILSGIPKECKSLVLIVDDPDIPTSVKEARGIEVFDHLVLFNIPPETQLIPEKGLVGTLGKNSRGDNAYCGPCPPDKEHRYFFKLYALNSILNLTEGATRSEVELAMKGSVIESTELIGRYERLH